MAAHALAGSGRDRLGLVVAVGLGVVPGLSAASGRLSAGLTRAGHVLAAAVLGWVRHGLVRPCLVPVTAVGREHVSRPSAAPWQHIEAGRGRAMHGRAGRGLAWQGATRQGQVWRGVVWLGPVTAVACGLVPQASAAPGQQPWIRVVAWPARTRHGAVRPGPARRGQSGIGRAWNGRTVFCGVRLPAAHSGWAMRGTVWRGDAGNGAEWHGQAWMGALRPGMAWVSRAASSHTGCEALAPSIRGVACIGRAGLDQAWCGRTGQGEARQESQGGWQTSRFESVTPAPQGTAGHGMARICAAGCGLAWRGKGSTFTSSGVTHV